MTNEKLDYLKDVAFINREQDLKYLRNYINIRPESILFLHGPKSSGKTTLLYKFFDQIQKEQKMEVKFLDLRETFTNVYEDFLKTFFRVETQGEKVEKKILEKRADPFKVMEAELLNLTREGIKPVLIIDELQALEKIYLDNDKERQLITALFNFFVAMTKQAHLAHIIIASSDGYFLNTIYIDSKLKKCSTFYKVDYLMKEDVMEWLLNLEKYSKITDYTLTEADAEKIWDTVGGSMWEIQDILSQLFEHPIDNVLAGYKQKMLGLITYYVVQKEREKRENILKRFIHDDNLWVIDTGEGDEVILKDMVTNNILYFDPTRAVYYPQGKSYHWGIRMYFESLKSDQRKK
jgi:hypothetical protein